MSMYQPSLVLSRRPIGNLPGIREELEAMKLATAASIFVLLGIGTTAYGQTCTQDAATCRTGCPDSTTTHTSCPSYCEQERADCMKTGFWQKLNDGKYPARKE
jgi:hypothetical protein